MGKTNGKTLGLATLMTGLFCLPLYAAGGQGANGKKASAASISRVALKAIVIEKDKVTLSMTGLSAYEAQYLPQRGRVVLSLTGVVLKSRANRFDANGKALWQVRCLQYEASGRPVTQVIFKLKRGVGYSIARDGNNMVVSFRPLKGDAGRARKTAVAARAPQAVVQGIRVEGDKVVLAMSGLSAYTAETVLRGKRIILDLPNVSLRVASGRQHADGALLADVRYLQYEADGRPVAQIVFRLKQNAAYDISREGNNLVIALKPAVVPALIAGTGTIASSPASAKSATVIIAKAIAASGEGR